MPNFESLYKERLSRELNNSDTSALFTSTRRQEAINDAQEEFADLTECLIRQSSITVSCNVSEYQMLSSGVLGGSTDYIRLAAQPVEYHFTDSNGTLRQLSGDEFPERPVRWLGRYDQGWRQSTTPLETPSGYYIRPDGGNLYLGLTEPPDVGSSETAQIVVPYVARPAPMTSTGDEPFTVNSTTRTDLRLYHKALPHYAAYKLLPLLGDMEAANYQLQQFLTYVARFKGRDKPRGGRHVMVARSYLNEAKGRGFDDDWRRVPGWPWRYGD